MNDELQSRLLADPLVGVCSDGSPTGFHPRGHGTFARIIEHYVMENEVLTLPEARAKDDVVSRPRCSESTTAGMLQGGMKADIVVFRSVRRCVKRHVSRTRCEWPTASTS